MTAHCHMLSIIGCPEIQTDQIMMLMTLITFMLNIKYSWMSGCTKRSAVVDEDYDVVHIKYQVFGCLVIQTDHRHRH